MNHYCAAQRQKGTKDKPHVRIFCEQNKNLTCLIKSQMSGKAAAYKKKCFLSTNGKQKLNNIYHVYIEGEVELRF